MGINRGTVLDLINDVHRVGGFKDYNSYSYLFDQVDTMPESKEDSEPHWIPVTERLPEPRIDVWCNSDLGQMVGYYDEMIETWFGRDYLELLVNAWMPLPEPYKGETT